MKITKVTYKTWNYIQNKRVRYDKTIVGTVVRDSPKQLVIKDLLEGYSATISKSNITLREDMEENDLY